VQVSVQSATDKPGKSRFSIQTIIQLVSSYNRILFNLLTNETVELIDLISSVKELHKVLLLYFMEIWPIELANKSTCKLSLIGLRVL